MIINYKIKSLLETKILAEKIAKELKIGDIVLLKGTLGAGKTYFAGCLINYLLEKDIDILSPTFSIVKEYDTKNFPLYHFDLYRLKNQNELYELDIETCFENGVSIIEWPEKIEDLLHKITFEIKIEIINENERDILINTY